MTRITLTPEQSALLQSASFPIILVDAQGRQFNVSPSAWSSDELAEMESWLDSGEPGISFEQVMAKIHAREQSACDTP